MSWCTAQFSMVDSLETVDTSRQDLGEILMVQSLENAPRPSLL